MQDNAWIVVAVVVFGVVATVWHFRRSRSLLVRWAARNGLTVVDTEWRPFRAGPYFWRRSKDQEVYRITTADAAGRRRTGYVRVGGWWLGMLSDAVDVTWDDER